MTVNKLRRFGIAKDKNMLQVMNYEDCVDDLICRLLGAGYEILWVADGGEDDERHELPSIKETVDAVCGVDESWIRVERDGYEHTLYIVLGNAKSEIVCDYSFSVPEGEGDIAFGELLSHFSDDWEERESK